MGAVLYPQALAAAKAEGVDAYRALHEALEGLKRPLSPTRYEVGGGFWGPRLVAVLEVEGVEADRAALSEEAVAALRAAVGLDEAAGLEALAQAANALPLEARPAVPFYPYVGAELEAILEVLEQFFELDGGDAWGSPLGAIYALGWR